MNEENKYKNWTVTVSQHKGVLPNFDEVESLFKQLFETYWIQMEEGEKNENLHYQATGVTSIRKRKDTILNKIDSLRLINRKHITLGICKDLTSSIEYCTDPDKRVEGTEPRTTEYVYSRRDIKFLDEETMRYPWQNKLMDILIDEKSKTSMYLMIVAFIGYSIKKVYQARVSL